MHVCTHCTHAHVCVCVCIYIYIYIYTHIYIYRVSLIYGPIRPEQVERTKLSRKVLYSPRASKLERHDAPAKPFPLLAICTP